MIRRQRGDNRGLITEYGIRWFSVKLKSQHFVFGYRGTMKYKVFQSKILFT